MTNNLYNKKKQSKTTKAIGDTPNNNILSSLF